MREEQFDRAIGDRAMPLPHPRFTVYRNNVASALINALRVRYPVTGQLVGAAFFAAMAGDFADGNRPHSPVLIGYGAEFAAFIATFAPASGVPYLADVARLESLWWQAYHAADATPLPAAELAAVPPEQWVNAHFAFHPSVALFSSPFAAASIWHAHKGGQTIGAIDIALPECAMVLRPYAEVEVRRLPAASHDFLRALAGGASLGEVAAALPQGFDLPSHLADLIALNIITGLHI